MNFRFSLFGALSVRRKPCRETRSARRSPASRRFCVEQLECRALLSLATPALSVQDNHSKSIPLAADVAAIAPAVSATTAAVADNPTVGTSQAATAVLPNLSGWWRGPLSETNPLGTSTFTTTLKITANPQWTSIFSGKMEDANGNSHNLIGTLSPTGKVVIDVSTEGMFIQFRLTGQLYFNRRMTGTVRILDSYGGETTGNFNFNRIAKPADIVATSLRWNPTAGGLTLRYDILSVKLPASPALDVALYWASGPSRNSAIRRIALGSPIPPQVNTGSYTYNIPGWRLRNAPSNATHILLVVDPDNKFADAEKRNNVFALRDVVLNYKTEARQVLSQRTVGVIKDALRYAGQKSGLVTSTYRTPREQAQAMYNNIRDKGVASQHKLYGPSGDAVIDAYESALAAYNRARLADPNAAIPDYVSIMEAKIVEVGPGRVSKHCSNFSVLQVVDLSYSAITNKKLFHRALASDARISKLLDPFTTPDDPAFHIEVPKA